MPSSTPRQSFFSRFTDRLRWRLTLSFTLVTLAAILMAAWWSFLAVNLYLTRMLPQSALDDLRSQIVPALIQVAIPVLLVLVIPALLVGSLFGFLTARWLESRLNHLRETTDAWSDGNFKLRIHDPAQDEIARFGRQLNQMASELETLLVTRQELAALEERNQLARDLHDSVKQNLAAAILQIGAAQALLEARPQSSRQALLQAEELAVQAQQELTNVILELRPAALHEKNLAGALEDYLEQWQQQNRLVVEFTHSDSLTLSFNQELTLFRIAQEALANIVRHSTATRVEIALQRSSDWVELVVADNGRGFDPAQISSTGFGLKSMRDRLDEIGGQLDIQSAAGHGTRLCARLALKPEGRSEESVHG
ncbi:MAG: sensor histidine kinase [Chloroflexota bacterium]